MIRFQRTTLTATLAVASVQALTAQSLENRVNSAPDGRVQFTYAVRAGVCGNGKTYIQTGPNSYTGTFYGNMNEVTRAEPCTAGPVRVVIDRADKPTEN